MTRRHGGPDGDRAGGDAAFAAERTQTSLRPRLPRLLLHVGLPKTATTSLQVNVLLPWERSGRINFLGVAERPCHRPFRNVYERIRRR